jgi:hypothetical protein
MSRAIARSRARERASRLPFGNNSIRGRIAAHCIDNCIAVLEFFAAARRVFLWERQEKRKAPGRLTSASLKTQSSLTVPHWITSFSTRSVDVQILKRFHEQGKPLESFK